MKALIWFLCFFVLAFVQMLFKDAGIILGGIPTALLWGLTWWIVKKLCSAWDKHKAKKVAEAVSRQSAEKALAGFVAEVATEQAKLIKENKAAQSMNLNDPEYGLAPEKPVYCCYVDGSEDYLNSLRTENGEKLAWNRRGSMYADGINGMVDIYDSTLPSGQAYKTVYVNMYADSNSTTVPAGFAFCHHEKEVSAPKHSSPKTRFCKLCGDPIDPVTRKCTGCRKQYFRPPVLTDKHYFIAATAVACIVVAFLLVMLISQRSTYEAQVAELNAAVSDLEAQLALAENESTQQSQTIKTMEDHIKRLQKTVEYKNEYHDFLRDEYLSSYEKVSFFDKHIVLIGKGNKYHKYDCSYLDTSDGFLAYNTENAKAQGYKACSHCCG